VALAACEAAGVPRETALAGMYAAEPDPGALRLFRGQGPRGRWTFADAFAANDPQSSAMLWAMLAARCPEASRRVLVVNCRADRLDRSRQMGEMLARDVRADACFLVGQETRVALRAALAGGADGARIFALAGATAAEAFGRVAEAVEGETLIVGMGNIHGLGEEIAARFRQESRLP